MRRLKKKRLAKRTAALEDMREIAERLERKVEEAQALASARFLEYKELYRKVQAEKARGAPVAWARSYYIDRVDLWRFEVTFNPRDIAMQDRYRREIMVSNSVRAAFEDMEAKFPIQGVCFPSGPMEPPFARGRSG